MFLPDLKDPISSGQAFFESSHTVIDPNYPQELPPVSKRADPFGTLAKDKVPGDVIFTSHHQGEHQGEVVAQAADGAGAGVSADQPAAKGASRRRGRGRRRAGAPAAAQPEAATAVDPTNLEAKSAPVLDEPYEDADDARGNLISPEQADSARGNVARSKAKPARPHGRRSGRPRGRGGQTNAGA